MSRQRKIFHDYEKIYSKSKSLDNKKEIIADEFCKIMGITADDLSDKDEDWIKAKIRQFKIKTICDG